MYRDVGARKSTDPGYEVVFHPTLGIHACHARDAGAYAAIIEHKT
jgi:hypothetical protein